MQADLLSWLLIVKHLRIPLNQLNFNVCPEQNTIFFLDELDDIPFRIIIFWKSLALA